MKCSRCGHETAVLSTRTEHVGLVLKRRRGCGYCGHKFSTYEVDDGLVETIKKYLLPHVKALRKRHELHARNEQILALLEAGEKHAVVASQFGLSDNMISTIARRAGVPAYRRTRKAA
jgi:transcriptional regulator NrdR family protein